jgi:hypothetical protein
MAEAEAQQKEADGRNDRTCRAAVSPQCILNVYSCLKVSNEAS